MAVLTFFVLYYHVFFVSTMFVLGMDYVFEVNLFEDVRKLLGSDLCISFIVIELLMAIAASVGLYIGSTIIMSILWVCTVCLICAIMLLALIHILMEAFEMN